MKNKKMLRLLKIFISVILCFAIFFGVLYASTCIAGFFQINKNIEYQYKQLQYLKTEYYTESYVPCDEQKFADFDIEKALAEGVKINEIAVLGTHNSYQLLATPQKRLFEKVRNILSFGDAGGNRNFEMDTYTQQLEQGVRNLEIDIATADDGEKVSFVVAHKTVTDNVSSAYDFAKGLEEIALWSDNNPNHMPIYLLIEPKDKPEKVNNIKDFSLEYAFELDNVIREVLGDRLLTPEIVKGDFESFEEMRMADSWPSLKDASGKIMVLLHPCDVTQEYIDADTSISSQAMFPMLRFENIETKYASFILDNEPEIATVNNSITVDEKKLMVRTRADNYPDFSDGQYKDTDSCGSHIITTDYPPRIVRANEHTYDFDGYTIKLLGKQ